MLTSKIGKLKVTWADWLVSLALLFCLFFFSGFDCKYQVRLSRVQTEVSILAAQKKHLRTASFENLRYQQSKDNFYEPNIRSFETSVLWQFDRLFQTRLHERRSQLFLFESRPKILGRRYYPRCIDEFHLSYLQG